MARGESDSPGARALRAAGYVKMPAFWVPVALRDEFVSRAEKHLNNINWIKDNAEGTKTRTSRRAAERWPYDQGDC